VQFLTSVDSTNAEARRRVEADVAPPIFALVARRQTHGRGRRGREWITLPGSLALTLALPDPGLPRPARVALIAAVVVARAAEALGAPRLAIKWPNDLIRDDRKAGGILVETARTPDGSPRLLLGIGLNLSLQGLAPPPFAVGDLGLDRDASTRDRLARSLVAGLLDALRRPDDPRLGAEYRARSWLTGRRVVLRGPDGLTQGRITDVSPEGDLALDHDRLLRGEHVSLVAVLD